MAFDIDANGIINVAATDLQTDISRRMIVEARARPSDEVVARLLADSRARLASDRRKREEIEAAIKAQNLIRAAQQLQEQAAQLTCTRDAAVPRLQQAAETAVAAVRDALAGGETATIVAAGQALEASLKKLSAAIKAAAPGRIPREQAA